MGILGDMWFYCRHYRTARTVWIPNRCLSITYWVFLVLIFLGGVCIVIWNEKHLSSCPVHSVVTTRVTGVLNTRNLCPDLDYYQRVWDAQDIVTPANGGDNGAVFVMTDILRTPNQTQASCPEDPDIAPCKRKEDCSENVTVENGNGVMTGECVEYGERKSCEIYAWCPVEDLSKRCVNGTALFAGTKNFRIRVKNFIEFPKCGRNYSKRNIDQTMTEEYLMTCNYHPDKDPYCPVFKVEDIVNRAGSNYENVSKTGGTFLIVVQWNCDFYFGNGIDDCKPKYEFQRIDNPEAKVSPGWNYKSVSYHEDNRRTLTHHWGIKILIEVEGEGKDIDWSSIFLKLGAVISYFSVAPIICDIILAIFCRWQKLAYWCHEFCCCIKKPSPGSVSQPTEPTEPTLKKTMKHDFQWLPIELNENIPLMPTGKGNLSETHN